MGYHLHQSLMKKRLVLISMPCQGLPQKRNLGQIQALYLRLKNLKSLLHHKLLLQPQNFQKMSLRTLMRIQAIMTLQQTQLTLKMDLARLLTKKLNLKSRHNLIML